VNPTRIKIKKTQFFKLCQQKRRFEKKLSKPVEKKQETSRLGMKIVAKSCRKHFEKRNGDKKNFLEE
jgi:hypothetical protein